MARAKDVIEKEKRRSNDIATLTEDDFFNLQPVLNEHANINVIVGMRSNGKTYSVLKKCLQDYKYENKKFVYVRRLQESITNKFIGELLQPFLVNDFVKIPLIKELWGEGYTIKYRIGQFELIDENDKDKKPEVIGYTAAINTVGTQKGRTFDHVYNIVFDEFLPLKSEKEVKEEFDAWEQLQSTIYRTHGNETTLWLLGNTVTKYSPFFAPYGINTFQMNEQGKIYTIELDNAEGEPTKVCYLHAKSNPKIGQSTAKLIRGSRMAVTGEYEIQDVAQLPHTDNERAEEKLVCTIFDSVMGINLGIFKRRAVWYTNECKCGVTVQTSHVREFLVIRQTTKTSNYFHLTTVKGLTYNIYTDVKTMFKDIKEKCHIDIYNELTHNRLYSENMFTADYFYHTYDYYSRTTVRDLL